MATIKGSCPLKHKIIKPSIELKTIVKQFIVIESFSDYEKLWVLPNAGNFIIFNRGVKACVEKYNTSDISHSIPEFFSIGIKLDCIVRINIDKKIINNFTLFPIIIVELLPLGFCSLFEDNAIKLREGHMLLNESLNNRDVSFDKLYTYTSIEKQIKYIENGLLSLKMSSSPAKQVFIVIEEIIKYITRAIHYINVADILRKFSYSRTSLERDFKKIVGFTPKEFIQIMRFCLIFKDIMINGYDFIKLEYNFFDQSHMSKAFKKFIDIPPSKLKAYIQENNINIYQLY